MLGDGDPSISSPCAATPSSPLRDLADSLRARGITRDPRRRRRRGVALHRRRTGFGWAWDDFDEPYSAGVDALFFNEGFTQVLVRAGGRPDDPARADDAVPLPRIRPVIRAVTVARPSAPADSARNRPLLTVGYDSSHKGCSPAGTIAVGDTAVPALAHRDLSGAYLAALREALRSRGVRVDEARRDSTARLDSLLAMRSPPLRDVLPALQKPSQNQIAELLFKTVALRATGARTRRQRAACRGAQLTAWGAEADGFAVRDGSGLSRHDYVTPRTLVQVLDAMRRHQDFKVFYDALPIAGVDGTIAKRMRGTAAQGNVHAKTGYIDKARSLSGYVTTADGRMLIFSMLCNNYGVPTRR